MMLPRRGQMEQREEKLLGLHSEFLMHLRDKSRQSHVTYRERDAIVHFLSTRLPPGSIVSGIREFTGPFLSVLCKVLIQVLYVSRNITSALIRDVLT
jgi:hypothetical protein